MSIKLKKIAVWFSENEGGLGSKAVWNFPKIYPIWWPHPSRPHYNWSTEDYFNVRNNLWQLYFLTNLDKNMQGRWGGDLDVQVPPILTLSYRRCEKSLSHQRRRLRLLNQLASEEKCIANSFDQKKNIIHNFFIESKSACFCSLMSYLEI